MPRRQRTASACCHQPDFVYQHKLLFDAAEQTGGPPKVNLYSLNDADWLAVAALCGSFQGGELKMRMQFGNAWWFNDTFSGMKKPLTMFAEQGLLGNFTGMLADSRSFREGYVICALFCRVRVMVGRT